MTLTAARQGAGQRARMGVPLPLMGGTAAPAVSAGTPARWTLEVLQAGCLGVCSLWGTAVPVARVVTGETVAAAGLDAPQRKGRVAAMVVAAARGPSSTQTARGLGTLMIVSLR